jgi:hypothetical protein
VDVSQIFGQLGIAIVAAAPCSKQSEPGPDGKPPKDDTQLFRKISA